MPNIGRWHQVCDRDTDRIAWWGAFGDGHFGNSRIHPHAHRNVLVPEISHSKLLSDPQYFEHWRTHGLIDFLRSGDAPNAAGPDPFALQRESIERAIASVLKPGEEGLFMAVIDQQTGKPITGTVVVAQRIGDSKWQWGGNVEVAWGGGVSGQVQILRSW
jgi:hypothetical protein